MKLLRTLRRDERGATVVETAFALPCLILMVWMVVQLGLIFRAMSGIQHALGEGARLATLWPQPDDEAIKDKVQAAVYGIGPGEFTISDPFHSADENGNAYLDLTVSYTQHTDLLMLPGPDITVSRSKRVWVADD